MDIRTGYAIPEVVNGQIVLNVDDLQGLHDDPEKEFHVQMAGKKTDGWQGYGATAEAAIQRWCYLSGNDLDDVLAGCLFRKFVDGRPVADPVVYEGRELPRV